MSKEERKPRLDVAVKAVWWHCVMCGKQAQSAKTTMGVCSTCQKESPLPKDEDPYSGWVSKKD